MSSFSPGLIEDGHRVGVPRQQARGNTKVAQFVLVFIGYVTTSRDADLDDVLVAEGLKYHGMEGQILIAVHVEEDLQSVSQSEPQ